MRNIRFMILAFALSCMVQALRAQSAEAQQLLLNVEKLARFKQILSDMKKGYAVLDAGYTQVRDITQGNFRLHHLFLDGLWQVRPEIKQYWKVGAIIAHQRQLARAVPEILSQWSQSDMLRPGELQVLQVRLGRVLQGTADHLLDLTQILTGYALRMNDAERLDQIDRIFDSVQQQAAHVKQMHTQVSRLLLQRERQHRELGHLKGLHLLNP